MMTTENAFHPDLVEVLVGLGWRRADVSRRDLVHFDIVNALHPTVWLCSKDASSRDKIIVYCTVAQVAGRRQNGAWLYRPSAPRKLIDLNCPRWRTSIHSWMAKAVFALAKVAADQAEQAAKQAAAERAVLDQYRVLAQDVSPFILRKITRLPTHGTAGVIDDLRIAHLLLDTNLKPTERGTKLRNLVRFLCAEGWFTEKEIAGK